MTRSEMTTAELERIKQDYGADELFIDSQGNIRDKTSHNIVYPGSQRHGYAEEKVEAISYFRSLPIAIKNELLKEALKYLTQQAIVQMNMYRNPNGNEKWCISHEEMAKLIAEGILLDDK